jgi:hypothetical protein
MLDDSVMCFGDHFGYVLLVLVGAWRRCVGDVLAVMVG